MAVGTAYLPEGVSAANFIFEMLKTAWSEETFLPWIVANVLLWLIAAVWLHRHLQAI